MTRASILAALLATPATAGITVTYEPGIVARVELHNEVERGVAPEKFITVETDHGPAVFRHVLTRNSETDPRDTLEAWSLPAGVVAIPAFIAVDEEGRGRIILYVWEGM